MMSCVRKTDLVFRMILNLRSADPAGWRTTPSVVMYAPRSIVSRAGQASPSSAPAPQGRIHPGKEHRDVCAARRAVSKPPPEA